MLFFCGATAYAQDASGLPELTTDESHPVYYLIKNLRKSKFANYTGDNSNMSQVSTATIGSLFYFTGTNDNGTLKVKIHNAATTKQMHDIDHDQWKDGARDWYIKSYTKNSYNGFAISIDNSFGYYSWNDYQGSGTSVGFWYADDAGSIWSFEKIADSQISSIYESTKSSAQAQLTKYAEHKDGMFLPTTASYNALQALASAETPSTVDEKIKAASDLYIQTLNFIKMPESGKIYLIQNYSRDNKAYMGIAITNATSTKYELKTRSVSSDKSDRSSYWMVEGNPGNYKFKNLGTGLYVGTTPTKWDYAYRLVDASKAGSFNIYPNDGDRYGTAAIGLDGYNKWHMAGGLDVVKWGTGEPTSWYFEEVDQKDIPESETKYTAKLADMAKTVATSFNCTDDAAYQSALADYESNQTFEKAQALVATVKEAPNKLWRIRSCCRNLAIKPGANLPEADWETKAAYLAANFSGNVGVRCNSFENNMPEAVWQIIPTLDGYYIYNLNLGKYVGKTNTAGNSQYLALADQKDAGLFDLGITEEGNQATFFCNNAGGNYHKYLHVSGYGLMNWNANPLKNSASAFLISEATDLEVALNTVGDASYATAYLPFAVSAAEGATLFTGELNTAEGKLKMTEAEGGVAAQQAIVLVGEAGTAKATLKIGEGKGVSTGISGTLLPKTVGEDTFLTLGRANGTGEIGFYKYTGTSIQANKAFIEGSALTAGQAAVQMFFGGEVTGIEGIEASGNDNDKAPVYDLSGRRVMKAVKGGLYIQNGRKFIAR